jgi:hypothetical protein|tara:strand:- start:2342 stop:2605 length:264 start_codon:yes stop_codon:yes gene_type:complete
VECQGARYTLKVRQLLEHDDGFRRCASGRHRTAETTAVLVRNSGEVMHPLSIEGDDLDKLTALRKQLGLRCDPNIAVHEAIETEISN